MAGEVGLFARDFDDTSIIRTLKSSSDGVLVTIPYNVQQLHSGRFFFASYYNATLANAANLDMLVVTGAVTTPHIAVMVDVGNECTLSIYEAATTSADGTGVTSYNANRASANVSTAVITHTPTVTGTGTALIPSHYVPGGGAGGGPGGSSIGGSSTDFARVPEIVLKTSTKYLFRLTNVSGGAIKASMQLGWFEDV